MTQPIRQRGGIGPGLIGRVGIGNGPAQVLSLAQLRRLGLGPAAAAASAVGQTLIAGTGVTITDNGDGTFTIASTGGGGGGAQQYGVAPAGFDPHSSNVSGTGFFVGRLIIMPKATTLNSIILPVTTTTPSCVVTPAIYGVTAGTYDIAALLKSGAAVTGIVKGLQTLPLTSGLAVTEGQVIWAGVTISGAAIACAVCSAAGSVFFTSPAAPPNPAASPSYNGTTACMWVAE